jgi:hypothetical protein
LEDSGHFRGKENVEGQGVEGMFRKRKWEEEEIPNEKSVNMQLKIRTYLNAEAI